MMSYSISQEPEGFTVFSVSDGRPVTRVGARPKLPAAQRLAEQTAGRRLTWVKMRDGGYTSA